MEQKFIRAFGRIFTENTYEQGLRHKLVVKDVVTCTIFCTRGYVESTDAQTGNRMQDNYAGLLLKASDFVCKEYDLHVTKPTTVFCYDTLINDNQALDLTAIDLPPGSTRVLSNDTKFFLCDGVLTINGSQFTGPTALTVTTGDKTATAQTRCLGLILV